MSTSTLEAYFTGPGEDSKDALMEGSAEAAGEAESVDATSSVRHSSRVRKPSRRAEEMAASSLPDSQSQLAKAIGLDRTDGERLGKGAKGRSGSQASKRSANLDDNGQSGGSEADEDDEGVYCLCRKGDDGKPMVLCGACNDWFHFKCVGLTKKAAEFVTVFICPPCEKATGRQSRDANNQTISLTGANPVEAQSPPQAEVSPPKRKHEEEEAISKRARPLSWKEASPQKPSQAPATSVHDSSVSSQPAASVPSVPSSTPPSQPARKASASGPPSNAINVQRTRSETLRKHAQQQFDNLVIGMMKEAEIGEDALEKSAKYAHDLEAALFDATSEALPKASFRIAGKAYRDKLRSFLFNLKDKSNTTLRRRIADGSLTPKELSSMTSEELANDAIRQEVERRKRENLEQSILKKEKAPLRKLTHKGEIDIEYENAQAMRVGDETEQPVIPHTPRDSGVGSHDVSVSSTPNVKSQEQGTSSDSPLRASQASPPQVNAAQRVSQSAQSPTLPFDFSNVWQGDQHPDGSEEDVQEGGTVEVADEVQGDVEDDERMTTEKTQEGTPGHADNFIDDFLGMPEGQEAAVEGSQGTETKDEAKQSASADHQQSPALPPVGWQGAINMPDEGAFSCAVRQVAGRRLADNEWANLFPSLCSLIEGRLPSGSAVPYLLQSRVATRTELVAFTAEAQWVPSAMSDSFKVKSASDNDDAFTRLVHYFTNKDRYGVLQPLRSARGRVVKDFYLAALPKDRAIPQWLELLQPDTLSAERVAKRDQDMFILVAVLFKQQSPPATAGSNPIEASRSPSGPGATPPTNISSILGPGSTTLQDLLRAVGGSRSQATTGATPTTPLGAGNQNPASAEGGYGAPIRTHDGVVPASSMQALSQMPKLQLEDVLTKNPSLVDDLLKTLGKASGPSSVPPPGPPPGPPPVPPPPVHQPSGGPGAQTSVRPAYAPHEYNSTYMSPPYNNAAGYGPPAQHQYGSEPYYGIHAQGYPSSSMPSQYSDHNVHGGFGPHQQPPSGPRNARGRGGGGRGGHFQRGGGGRGGRR